MARAAGPCRPAAPRQPWSPLSSLGLAQNRAMTEYAFGALRWFLHGSMPDVARAGLRVGLLWRESLTVTGTGPAERLLLASCPSQARKECKGSQHALVRRPGVIGPFPSRSELVRIRHAVCGNRPGGPWQPERSQGSRGSLRAWSLHPARAVKLLHQPLRTWSPVQPELGSCEQGRWLRRPPQPPYTSA